TPQLMDENIVALRALLQDAFKTATRDVWLEKFDAADIMCAPVNDLSEALADPQTMHNDMIWDLDGQAGRPLRMVGSPVHLSDTPPSVRLAPPKHGQHTDENLEQLGYRAATRTP